MKTPTDLSEEKLPDFFLFFFLFLLIFRCQGAPAKPQGRGKPRPAEPRSHLPLCLQFPILTPSPFTHSPSPRLPVWPTATVQCFWMFLSFTKWAYFKILYEIAFSYCPKSSSPATAAALGGNSVVHWYEKLIWIISIPEKLQKTLSSVKAKYCYKLNFLIRQLYQSTETLLRL